MGGGARFRLKSEISEGWTEGTHRSQGPTPGGGTEDILWGEPGPESEVSGTPPASRPPFSIPGRFQCGSWKCSFPGRTPQAPPLSDLLPVVLGFPSKSPTATEYPEGTVRVSSSGRVKQGRGLSERGLRDHPVQTLHCEDGEIEATERTRPARGHEANSVREVDVLAFGSWVVCRG